jgi:hypothetical protein
MKAFWCREMLLLVVAGSVGQSMVVKQDHHHHHRSRRRQPQPPKELEHITTPEHELVTKTTLLCDISRRRREVLQGILLGSVASLTVFPSASSAGEVGARITKAVTTSDLGISVRTSVVKGAQVIDQLDGQWEKFSDRFSLGTERSKRDGRPPPKIIPNPLPLDVSVAQRLLETSDRVFLSLTQLSANDLSEQIDKISAIVQPSFERSGLVVTTKRPAINFETSPQFNFASYVHFKAYSDLIIARGINFGKFRPAFEDQVGRGVTSIVLPGVETVSSTSSVSSSSKPQKDRLMQSLQVVDQFCKELEKMGLVALTERSAIEEDVISDWVADMADIQFTVALDGDITLNAQILLQEQGFLLYPNFARFAVKTLLEQPGQKVSCDDYYFDTDYSSDPDKFEVKEVLLNVVVESE